jgi:hypothetical protein
MAYKNKRSMYYMVNFSKALSKYISTCKKKSIHTNYKPSGKEKKMKEVLIKNHRREGKKPNTLNTIRRKTLLL